MKNNIDYNEYHNELKAFKRILKELNIYKYYINCRIERYSLGSKVNPFPEKINTFSGTIDATLTWADTKTPYLWERLYETAKHKRCTDIVKDKPLIEVLQSLAKINLKKITL